MRDEGKSISAKDYIDKVYEDFPRWAISLAGLRHRENLTQKQLGEMIDVKQYKPNGKRAVSYRKEYSSEACKGV